jgi:hypothetical protein
MSAPPIAMTMWMPNSSAITVITSSGIMPASTSCACTNAPPNQITAEQAREVQPVPRRQQQRLAADLPGQLAERDDRARERHGADEDADVDLDLVDRLLGALVAARSTCRCSWRSRPGRPRGRPGCASARPAPASASSALSWRRTGRPSRRRAARRRCTGCRPRSRADRTRSRAPRSPCRPCRRGCRAAPSRGSRGRRGSG